MHRNIYIYIYIYIYTTLSKCPHAWPTMRIKCPSFNSGLTCCPFCNFKYKPEEGSGFYIYIYTRMMMSSTVVFYSSSSASCIIIMHHHASCTMHQYPYHYPLHHHLFIIHRYIYNESSEDVRTGTRRRSFGSKNIGADVINIKPASVWYGNAHVDASS
jgi:hypothetical protein